MIKGFKEFILRGNVIDLAVAVVIGAAFTAIVNALVDGHLQPALGALFNAEDLNDGLDRRHPTVSGGSRRSCCSVRSSPRSSSSSWSRPSSTSSSSCRSTT